MTLREFRKLTADLSDDTVILIKGQDEYNPPEAFGGFRVVDGAVSPDGEVSPHVAAADIQDEDSSYFGWTPTKVLALDASD